MFCLPSLTFSYTASSNIICADVSTTPHVELLKELEVMERKMQGVMTTANELASQLRQMIIKEKGFNNGSGQATSSSPMWCEGKSGNEACLLEVASRLVGEVHMANPRAKLSELKCTEHLFVQPNKSGQVPKPAFPVEKHDESQGSHPLASHHIGTEDQEEAEELRSCAVKEVRAEEGDGATGLERGKNPVCLLQELLVANNATHLPKYHLIGEYGPGHSKIFKVRNNYFLKFVTCYIFRSVRGERYPN